MHPCNPVLAVKTLKNKQSCASVSCLCPASGDCVGSATRASAMSCGTAAVCPWQPPFLGGVLLCGSASTACIGAPGSMLIPLFQSATLNANGVVLVVLEADPIMQPAYGCNWHTSLQGRPNTSHTLLGTHFQVQSMYVGRAAEEPAFGVGAEAVWWCINV